MENIMNTIMNFESFKKAVRSGKNNWKLAQRLIDISQLKDGWFDDGVGKAFDYVTLTHIAVNGNSMLNVFKSADIPIKLFNVLPNPDNSVILQIYTERKVFDIRITDMTIDIHIKHTDITFPVDYEANVASVKDWLKKVY